MPINAYPKLRRLFRLRTILLIVMLSVLILPLGSIYFLRFYENELVRKTELELISQSAALAATYRQMIQQNHPNPEAGYHPIPAQLDLSSYPVLPPRPAGKLTVDKAHPLALQAGQHMQTILAMTQQITLAGMRLLDNQGIVIAGQNEVGLSLVHIPEIQRALQGEYTPVIRKRISKEPEPPVASLSRGTKIRIFTAFPILDQGKVYGVVYLSRTPQNILKHLYARKEKVLLLTLLVLGLTGLLVLFISSRLSRPIRELIEQTKRLTKGDIKTVELLHQPGTYELAELSKSFTEMSKTLYERSTYINKFASHVSHEFKTPLTSMQGTMELLQEHIDDMPVEQRQRFFDNLQKDTQRLQRLVNRLLEQARADSTQASSATSLLVDILQELHSHYASQGLEILYNPDAVNVTFNIAPEQLRMILNNLFDNSLHHAATQITVTLKNEPEQCILTLVDNGTGISPANRKRIFTPFFTTRREQGGTGLGLGIVESLLKAWNGKITLCESDQGACFKITLLSAS